MPRVLAVLTMIAGSLLASCAREKAPQMEPFARNRLAVVARQMDAALTAQERAAAELAQAFTKLETEAAPGADAAESYDLARRLVSQAESRERIVADRVARLEAMAASFFEEWDDDLDDYADKALREESERNRTDLKTRYDLAVKALKQARRTTAPGLVLLRDRALWYKHARTSPEVPGSPPVSVTPGEALEKARAATEEARQAAGVFIGSVPRLKTTREVLEGAEPETASVAPVVPVTAEPAGHDPAAGDPPEAVPATPGVTGPG